VVVYKVDRLTRSLADFAKMVEVFDASNLSFVAVTQQFNTSEAHLRRILSSYAAYYNEVRTHLFLSKNAPVAPTVQRIGQINAIPLLRGLHHQYVRI